MNDLQILPLDKLVYNFECGVCGLTVVVDARCRQSQCVSPPHLAEFIQVSHPTRRGKHSRWPGTHTVFPVMGWPIPDDMGEIMHKILDIMPEGDA
jgi:hypothetical protein